MKRQHFTLLFWMVLTLFSFREMNAQSAVCHPSITKSVGSTGCFVSLTFDDIDNGSTDFDSYVLSQTLFTGPDTFQVELTVMQTGGQSSTCTSTLYVTDDLAPVALVKNNVYIRIDTTNTATITPAMVNAGSFDNCTSALNMSVSPSQVSCQDVSPVAVTLTVTDDSGNSAQAVVNVRLSNASNNVTTMVCNNLIQVTLNEGGYKKMYPYEILEGGPYKCWEQYSLDILENNVPRPDDFVRYSDAGKNLVVRVRDNATQNACWGEIKVKSLICSTFIACDTESRCYATGDCTSGHSTDDDVEWPCDIVLIDLPSEILDNPTPQLIAQFTQQDIDEYRPIFYNNNNLCDTEISVTYTDQVFPLQNGKLIYRTWAAIHWPTEVVATYKQSLQLGENLLSNCDICDVLAWDTPFTDCANGHSDLDAVEWPADITIDGMRISPADLWYETGINRSNVMPSIKENCLAYVEVVYEDTYNYISIDTLHTQRVWKIHQKANNELFTYTQNIIATNIPNEDAKVCIRRMNGEAMNNVVLFPDVTLGQGPCLEFTLQPSHTVLKPEKPSSDYVGGVDLVDLILLYEHVLGIRELDALQQAAGDFNGNGIVSTLDVVMLTRMLEGETVNLSSWPSPWKFGYHYLDFNPKTDFANEVNLVLGLPQNYGHHFVGYKLGDINDSYLDPSIVPLPLNMKDKVVTKGEIYSIPVMASNDMNIKGIQMKVEKNSGTEIQSISSELFSSYETADKGSFWSFIGYEGDGNAIEVKAGDILFTVEIEANRNDVLHNILQFLQGEHQKIIFADYQSRPFEIFFEDLITVGTKNAILSNVKLSPNPAHDVIRIEKDGLGDLDVIMYSSVGAKVLQKRIKDGENISIDHLQPSMYLVEIRDENGNTVRVSFSKQ